MAFTTSTRIKALIKREQTAFHNQPDDDAITQAVNGANAHLEKIGVASTETDAMLLAAADRLAISYLIIGVIAEMAWARDSQAVGSLRLLHEQLRNGALEDAAKFVTITRPKPKAVRNRNWLNDRGGPLRRGSEAGTWERTTP